MIKDISVFVCVEIEAARLPLNTYNFRLIPTLRSEQTCQYFSVNCFSWLGVYYDTIAPFLEGEIGR